MFGKKISSPASIKAPLTDDLKTCFGDNLVSVILYGSAATPRYVPGKSDINILTVLKDNSLPALEKVNTLEKKWTASKVDFTFFLTPTFIRTSLDAFPLEFLEVKRTGLVWYGEDLFKELTIDRNHLRRACERELRGKLLHLRREYVRSQGSAQQLARLIPLAAPQFLLLGRGALSAAGVTPAPETPVEVIAALELAFSLKLPAAARIARGDIPAGRNELKAMVCSYAPEMESLSNAVDQMKIPSTSEKI